MYVCSLRTNKWSYDHRQEGAALGQKMSYIRQTAGDRGALKDIQIFGMSSWLRQVSPSRSTRNRLPVRSTKLVLVLPQIQVSALPWMMQFSVIIRGSLP